MAGPKARYILVKPFFGHGITMTPLTALTFETAEDASNYAWSDLHKDCFDFFVMKVEYTSGPAWGRVGLKRKPKEIR